MVVVISVIVAILLTSAIAIVLYPIAAIFWVLGQLGKVSSVLFKWTKRIISNLWADIFDSESENKDLPNSAKVWVCSCGCKNTGKFCSECGKTMPENEKI